MNVLLINGSPHAKGYTYTALHEVEAVLNQEGIDTEIVHVGNKAIRGCTACFQCVKLHKCVMDDVVNEVTPIPRVNPKFCVKFTLGENRAIFIWGGSRGIWLPPF